jgi:hypothetical protein
VEHGAVAGFLFGFVQLVETGKQLDAGGCVGRSSVVPSLVTEARLDARRLDVAPGGSTPVNDDGCAGDHREEQERPGDQDESLHVMSIPVVRPSETPAGAG